MLNRRTPRRRQASDAVERNFVAQIIVPSVVVIVAMVGLLTAFMVFTGSQGDKVAIERQRQVLTTMLDYNIVNIPHQQEAGTVWDVAVEKIHAPVLDMVWLDANLGTWMTSYHGHDEAYILNPTDRPVYAMQGGIRTQLSSYDQGIEPVAKPLIQELRRELMHPSKADIPRHAMSPGSVDLAYVHGHLAVISIKPIVTDTGRIHQTPDQIFLHISVRYLDGTFISEIARRFEVADAHFSLKAPDFSHQQAIVLRTHAGRAVGYFIWTPFQPGTLLVWRIAPALAIALLAVLLGVGLLLRKVHKSALQLFAANVRAQHLAFHDTLTGLANRALFDDRLSRDLARTRREQQPLALLLLDLDHFKRTNDNLGHPAGDALIAAFGTMLVRTVDADDIVARIGGDEFAIIHVGPDAAAGAERLADRILAAIDDPFDIEGRTISSSASIGIAIAPHHAVERIELFRKADIALHAAKQAGRRRYLLFDEKMDDQLRERHAIETDLRIAVAEGQLEVWYQPFFASATMQIAGIEALVRWNHPRHGLLLPTIFIPIAEESGLIEQLGEWVLEQACIAVGNWPGITVSVNVSAVQLRNPAFAQRVFPILKRTHLDATRLELEITETSFIESTEQIRFNLGRLRDIGVKLALDDFGTGYSSFRHLNDFDIDRIKIDHSFVNAIDLTTGGSAVIRAIVDLARARGLRTTAEGVEAEEQSHFLTSIGCDSQQGFLFSRPLQRSEVDQLFQRSDA
ncbi:periplasmic sensor diguanylate cyclase/phosphodiesterase [Sphingomonas sp. YR710]|nr:periplasmic sensor diguanylate cyclase/phosphodiesterase [Sphingomonas sp. YR710]